MANDIRIEGLDLIDTIEFIKKKKNKYLAIMLNDLETIVPQSSPQYKEVRKIVLDGINDYTRSVLRVFFGDIEEISIK